MRSPFVRYAAAAFPASGASIASAHDAIRPWHEHMWSGAGGHVGSIPFIGIALLVGLLAIAFVVGRRSGERDRSSGARHAVPELDARAELERRYARGEIDEEELERRRTVLEG